MFYLSRNEELTVDILQKMLNKFNTSVVGTLRNYKNIYDGKQKILTKQYKNEEEKNNNSVRVVTNYAKNIVDSYNGYISSPGFISYSSQNAEEIEPVMEVLRYNDHNSQDAAFLLDMLIFGVANELMYLDSSGHTRFKLINPLQCFGVYDDSLTNDLLYFVRFYKASQWDTSNKYYLDVYTDYSIKHYVMSGENGSLIFQGEEPHYFSQCPANIAYMADEKSVFDCIIGLQDTFNELLTSEIDDYSSYCDAYLTISGAADTGEEEVKALKKDKVMILPPGAAAAWLTKNASDTQVENILKRIHDSIYRIAACPDFSSETFVGGVSSGIALRYRLCGMEIRAAKIEAEMKKALQRRIEIISGIASLKLGEEVFRDIEITFKRNIPEDETSIINLVNSLKGTVSDATLLSQLPFITDVNKELEAIQEQKKANMEIYGFPAPSTDTEEEETEE